MKEDIATSMDHTVDDYYGRLTSVISSLDRASIVYAANIIKKTWLAGKQIICFGNGGSALIAQHFIMDWCKSVYMATGTPFLGRCLAENMGLITAYANDTDYSEVFVRQLMPIVQPGDLVVGISGSGNSSNVLKAIDYANEQGNVTLGLCGYDGGELYKKAANAVHVPVNDMQMVEDIFMTTGHITMQILCSHKPLLARTFDKDMDVIPGD